MPCDDLVASVQRGPEPALPHVLCALSRQSSLAASLRCLLQNDSLLDIAFRRGLYLELVQLLKHLGEQGLWSLMMKNVPASLRSVMLRHVLVHAPTRSLGSSNCKSAGLRAVLERQMQLHDYPGTRGELLPTLLQPADFDKAQASIDGCTSAASAGPEDGPAQCCMDAMANLNAQCVVFKRSADALGTQSCPICVCGQYKRQVS